MRSSLRSHSSRHFPSRSYLPRLTTVRRFYQTNRIFSAYSSRVTR